MLTVTLELGNDAMRTGADLAGALERIGAAIAATVDDTAGTIAAGTVRDDNGNTVGRWTLEP